MKRVKSLLIYRLRYNNAVNGIYLEICASVSTLLRVDYMGRE
jgi:hypothetical protein